MTFRYPLYFSLDFDNEAIRARPDMQLVAQYQALEELKREIRGEKGGNI